MISRRAPAITRSPLSGACGTGGRSSTTARSRRSRTGSIRDESMTITCRRVSEVVGAKSRPVPGHVIGLDLSDADKAALIAFLRTL